MAALRVRWNMSRRKKEEGKEQQEEAEAEDEDEEVNESKLEETFSKLGPLEALVLSPERSNRYAIVYYKNLKDAKDAKYILHGARLLGTSAVLHLEIIGQEDVKAVSKHAVCDTTQSCDTFSQPSHILKGIFRSLRNKLISPSEAFEDLNQLAIKLEDKIKNQPDKWAPAVYERLLSKDEMESTLADCFLKFMKSKLSPPTPVLSQIVAQNIHHNLLNKIEELVQVQSYKVAAVNAWSWLIQLLGTHGVENKNLINRMLKILEKTFIDKDIEVRIASQVAWKAMIDIIVPSPFEITKVKTSDTREDINWPPGITSKRMKLLMTPIIGIMTLDNAARSLNSCWKICIYVLQKLDSLLNNTSVMQFILFPMFESAFNPGRNSWNMSVWDSSACLFEEFLSCKLKINPNVKMIKEGAVIKWPIWSSVHIGCLLKIFESLWNSCVRAFPDSDNNRLLLKYVFRIWHLILKGLALDRVMSVEGMEEHQKAVHETLKLVSSICEDVPSLCIEGYKKKLILTVWSLLEFMVIEFGHEILATSLYELSLENNNLGTCILSNTYSLALKTSCASNRETKQINAKVTPIYYISVIWMKCIKALGFHHENNVEDFCKMIDKDSLLSLWMAFIGQHRGEQPLDVSDFKDYCQYERVNEFPFPLLLFPCLMSSILRIKKIAEALECLVHSKVPSTYSAEKWSLSADLNNVFSMGYNLNCLNGGIGHPSSLVASMSSGSDLMGAIQFNFIRLCERLVTDVVLKSCKSLQNQNFVYSLSMVAGFLMLISDRKVSCFYTNSSVLGALSDLSNLLSNEQENSVFLKVISEPLACWLACCSDYKYNSYANILEGRQHLLSFSKHLEFFLRTFGSLISPVDSSNLQGVVEFKCNKSSSALALVSRYLTISWNSVTYNSERDKESISRVCDALMCLCNSLESRDEILAIMQALSSPLIKWFSNSLIDESSMVGDHYVGLVEKIWFAMLTSFENCQSAASFDLETLEKIAELLASALKCAHSPIAEKTVLFWGKTFGAKNIDISILQDSQSDLSIMSLPKKETIHLSNESFSEKDIQKGNIKQYKKHETIVGADQGQMDDQKTSRIIDEDLSEKKLNGKNSVGLCAQNEEEQPCKKDSVNTQKTIVNKRRGKNKGFKALGVRKEIRKCGSISGLSRECSITIANEEATSERDSLGEHVISKSNVKRRRDRRRNVPMFLKALKSDIKILGIRHVRLLRNIAGRLRGGKPWRNRNRMLGIRNAIRKKKKRSQPKRQINIPDKDIDRFADAEAMDSNDFMGPQSENPKLDSWQMSDIPFRVRTLVDGIRSDDGDGDANLLSKRSKDSRQDVVAGGCTSTVEFDLPSLEKKLDITYRRNPRKKKSPKRLPSHLLLDEILTDEELLTSVEGMGTEEDGDYISRPVKRPKAHSTNAFSLSTQLGNKNQIDDRASPGTNVHCKYGESQMIYNVKQAHHIPDGTLAFGSSSQLTSADRGDNDGCSARLNLNSEACKSNASSGGSERCFTLGTAASRKFAKDIIKRARMCDVLHELSTSDAIEEMGVEEVCLTIQRLNVLSEKLMERHKTLPTVPR